MGSWEMQQRVGGRGRMEFEHRNRFGGRQEGEEGLEGGKRGREEQTVRWLLAMPKTGGSW